MRSLWASLKVAISISRLVDGLAVSISGQMRTEAEGIIQEKSGDKVAESVLKWINKAAAKNLIDLALRQAERHGVSDSDLEDIIQDISEVVARRKIIQKALRSSGPRTFLRTAFIKIIQSAVRNLKTRQKRYTDEVLEDRAVVLDPAAALSEREMRRDLRKYVLRRTKHPAEEILFNEWMDAIEKYGPDLNVKRQLLPKVSDRLGLSDKTLYNLMGKVKKLVVEFFRSELDMNLPKSFPSFQASVVDRLVYREYRKRIAGWVLGNI